MKRSTIRHACAGRAGSSISAGIALGFLGAASACSGYYPLGRDSGEPFPTDPETPVASAAAHVSPILATPNFTLFATSGSGLVHSLGDIDGDGRDDLGTAEYDGASRRSLLHIRYGRARPTSDREVADFDQSGARVFGATTLEDGGGDIVASWAGDVDGDGYGDFLVQTLECDRPKQGLGAYLVYGGPTRLDGVLSVADTGAHFIPPDVQLGSEMGGTTCGNTALAIGVGDLDGDGLADFALTSNPLLDYLEHSAGDGVYVFYGRKQRFSGELPYASADAWIRTDTKAVLAAVGDVNGDGHADLLIDHASYDSVPGSFFLAGQAERLRGSLELSQIATFLEGTYPAVTPHSRAQDLDGDGIDDLILQQDNTSHLRDNYLVYGTPGIFTTLGKGTPAGARVDTIGAAWLDYIGSGARVAQFIGDRDGDGKAELVAQLYAPGAPTLVGDLAVLSGSAARMSGATVFPAEEVHAAHPEGLYGDRFEGMVYCVPAGDLDGDGALDVITVSQKYFERGDGSVGFDPESYRFNFHYGTPSASRWANTPR
jgi:hypothetical protein